MKKIGILLIGSLTIFLLSCGHSRMNFTHQKFTQLHALKPVYSEQEDKNQIQFVEIPSQRLSNQDLYDQPVTNEVKEAMDRGDLVLLHYQGQDYILRNPQFDIIYQSLSGYLVVADPKEYKTKQRIELTIKELEENKNGSRTLYLKEVDDVKTVSQEEIDNESSLYEDSKPINEKPDYSKPEIEANSQPKFDVDRSEVEFIHHSRHIKQAGKLRAASIVSFLAIALFLGFFVFSFWFFGILALMACILTFFLMVGVVVNYRRYKIECDRYGIEQLPEHKIWKGITWLGLFVFSLPLLGIPMLIPILSVAFQSRK
ncbi:MAG: hypothetical protein R2780_03655 [Crocinitomicaceae bacterium]|nr:hypothetical protein [Crocinitomicaceae bacterium]